MREVLYRGKAINRNKGYHRTKYKNGDWVYGLLSRLYDENFQNLPAEMTNEYGVSGIEIDHNTVGQYTGLTDKNGKKIFEGDICSSKGMIYQIIWLGDKYGWFCKVLKSISCLIDTTMAFPLYQYDNRPENGYRQLEIIGNIHDNPELLKGGGSDA